MNGTVNQGMSLHKGQAGKEDPKNGCYFWVLAISLSGGCYFRNRLYNYVIYFKRDFCSPSIRIWTH